jgi:hypothetical protein
MAGAVVVKWWPQVASGRMGYREMPNSELAKRSLAMVQALRELQKNMNAADQRIEEECDRRDSQDKSAQDRGRIRQSCNDASLKSSQGFLAQYEERYRAEVLILREEMLHRLPELRGKAAPPILASHPTNALGLGEVAANLEVLAKLLPKPQNTT